MRPARAKALIINAFASAGRFAFINPYTHGGALDYVLIGLSFPNLFPSVFQSFPLCFPKGFLLAFKRTRFGV